MLPFTRVVYAQLAFSKLYTNTPMLRKSEARFQVRLDLKWFYATLNAEYDLIVLSS